MNPYATTTFASCIFGSATILAQTAASPENVFVSALNYVGLGAVALVALYLLQEQTKQSRLHIEKTTDNFLTALEGIRKDNNENCKTLASLIAAGTPACRIEHASLVTTLSDIHKTQERTLETIKEVHRKD